MRISSKIRFFSTTTRKEARWVSDNFKRALRRRINFKTNIKISKGIYTKCRYLSYSYVVYEATATCHVSKIEYRFRMSYCVPMLHIYWRKETHNASSWKHPSTSSSFLDSFQMLYIWRNGMPFVALVDALLDLFLQKKERKGSFFSDTLCPFLTVRHT